MSSKLTLVPAFDYDRVAFSKESEIHSDFVLEAPSREAEKRIPLHMILGIDLSGSMCGSKINSVKSTSVKLVENLTEDDTLGIVGFSNDAWEEMPALPMTSSNKERALSVINGMRTRNMTNMGACLEWCAERAVTADKNKVCRVVILTDGQPTTGVMEHENLVKIVGGMNPRISVSTFGYGVDYDPELLTSMSTMGKGNHFYIQKDEDCRSAFAMELGGLLSLYAQDIKVTVTPAGNMGFQELLSSYPVEANAGYRGLTDGKVTFTIDDIYIGEKKHAIAKWKIPEASEAVCARPSRLCDISVEYLDVESHEKVEFKTSAKIQYVKTSKTQKKANDEVRKQLMIIEAARIQLEAKEKADKGDYKEAQNILQRGIVWVGDNAWNPDGAAFQESFQNIASNCVDRFSYNSVGSKMANSYSSMLTRGRVSSGDAVLSNMSVTSYTSDLQNTLLSSFGVDSGGSAKGSIVGPAGSGGAKGAVDPEDEKKKNADLLSYLSDENSKLG